MYIAKAGQPIMSARAPLYAKAAPAAPSMPQAPICSPAPSVSAHVFPFRTFFATSGNTASARSAGGGGSVLAGVWPLARALALVVTMIYNM